MAHYTAKVSYSFRVHRIDRIDVEAESEQEAADKAAAELRAEHESSDDFDISEIEVAA